MKRIALVLFALVACGGGHDQHLILGGPASFQGAAAVTSFAGEIDPTLAAASGGYGLTACSSSCTGLAEHNRAALKSAVDYVATHPVRMYIPPGQYPIGCANGQAYGVDTGGDSNVYIRGYGAVLRFTGDQGNAACSMFHVRNGANLRFEGVTFSGRDATNVTADTNLVRVGDGGDTTVDNVQFQDVQWIEGVANAGDCLRLDGGTSTTTVSRVGVSSNRFEGCARAAVDIRPGSRRVNVSYSFFRSNVNRDLWCEDTGDGPIGQLTIVGNMFERAASANAVAVTLSGHGGTNSQEQSTFSFNRVVPVIGQTTGGGGVEGSGLGSLVFGPGNVVTVNRSTSAPNVSFTGKAYDVTILDNYLERDGGASDAAVIKVATAGGVSPDAVTVRGNRILQYSGSSPGIDLSGTTRFSVAENNITYHAATADSGADGFVGVYCSGASASACSGTIERTRVKRDDQNIKASLDLATKTTNDNTVVQARLPGTPGNSITIAFVGDAGTNAGSIVEGTTSVTIHYRANGSTVANVETLFGASTLTEVKTTGTAANVLQAGDAFSATNLAGAAQAGRPLAGVEVLKGAGTTVGRLVLRDNWTSGARDQMYVDADGPAAYPDGYPLVDGNQAVDVTNEFEGGITTWRTTTTSDAETIASGALSVSKHTAFVTTANTVAYTLADGIVDGFVKCEKIKSTSGVPVGTLTPAHFADGVTHTITWTAAGGYACEAWDATGATWRLVGSSNVTIN